MINGQQYVGTPLPVGGWNITREQRKVTNKRASAGFAAAQSSGAYGSCITFLILCHRSNYACFYVCIFSMSVTVSC